MNVNKKHLKKVTISNYSSRNATFYDDPMNKNFVYGELTVDFVNKIELKKTDKIITDIGCGTGFAFDIIYEKLKKNKTKCIGIEPAKGMLILAKNKFKSDDNFSFYECTFGKIPLKDKSVDKIISTLALHWVPSIIDSIKELKRILKSNGSIDILMIDKNDGESFKLPVIEAMKKHLTFKQIMKAASLAQRVSSKHIYDYFNMEFDLINKYTLTVQNVKKIIYGTFDEHMKWWKARSEQIIAEVKNKNDFMNDLKNKLETINTKKGIPFDLSALYINLKRKNNEKG